MSRSRNIVVGFFLIGGVLLFGVGLFLIGDRRMLFSDSFYVHAEFAGLAGISNGAKVRVGGMDAGEVVEITVPPGPASKFRIRARVIDKLHPLVRTDSVATIQNDGIVGNKFLQIDPGSQEAPRVPENGTIQSREPFELSDLMVELRETIGIANRTIEDVKGDVVTALSEITEVAQQAQTFVDEAGNDVKQISAAGAKISQDVQLIIADVRAGRGTVGKLLNDDTMYSKLNGATADLSAASQNVRTASKDVQAMVGDLRTREVTEEIEKTIRNVQQLTEQVKTTMAGFQSQAGGATLTTDLRETLRYARETMENMAENTEALKRNWFFRGFFQDRGFYDLDQVTLSQYSSGEFARGRKTLREWITASDMFAKDSSGAERLTQAGKDRIESAMAEFLRYPRDSFIMVEGYASQGSAGDQFLASRARAMEVKEYLVSKYRLDPRYIGTMPMGAVPAGGDGPDWDGTALVLFYKDSGKDSKPVRSAGESRSQAVRTDPSQ